MESGLDRTYVSAVERLKWNISLSNIERLANALELPPWQLLCPPEEATRKPKASKAA